MTSKKDPKGKTETSNKAPSPMDPSLLSDIRGLILSARRQAAQTINAGLTMLYWGIGKRIRQYILKEKRASYGKEIVAALGRELEYEFGRGFGEKSGRQIHVPGQAFCQ